MISSSFWPFLPDSRVMDRVWTKTFLPDLQYARRRPPPAESFELRRWEDINANSRMQLCRVVRIRAENRRTGRGCRWLGRLGRNNPLKSTSQRIRPPRFDSSSPFPYIPYIIAGRQWQWPSKNRGPKFSLRLFYRRW